MSLEILFYILIGILLLCFGLIVYARWNYGTLESQNIIVSDRSFFMGSNPDLHYTVQHYKDIERFKRHGPVFGVYEGRNPAVYICDLELIQRITMKDYDHFYNRRKFEFGDEILNEIVDFQQDEKWKILRSCWAPSFASGRVKRMTGGIIDGAEEMTKFMKMKIKDAGGVYKMNLRQVFSSFVVDATARGVFELKIDNVYDPNNHFIKNFGGIVGENIHITLPFTIATVFPFIMKLVPSEFGQGFLTDFCKVFMDILKQRKSSGVNNNDMLDKMNGLLAEIDSEKFKNLEITEKTVMSNTMLTMVAGFDPMSTCISFLIYSLAEFPEIQKRVTKEVDNFWDKYDGKVEHENLSELVYLKACINEILRIYPPFIRYERICNKDWEMNGIQIKKGQLAFFPIWALHRNPEYFPEPEKFDPERFMPGNTENNLKAFLTFGSGNKSCVGIRFSYELLTVGLIYILKHFNFSRRDDSKIKYFNGNQFMVKYDPIYLNCKLRN